MVCRLVTLSSWWLNWTMGISVIVAWLNRCMFIMSCKILRLLMVCRLLQASMLLMSHRTRWTRFSNCIWSRCSVWECSTRPWGGGGNVVFGVKSLSLISRRFESRVWLQVEVEREGFSKVFCEYPQGRILYPLYQTTLCLVTVIALFICMGRRFDFQLERFDCHDLRVWRTTLNKYSSRVTFYYDDSARSVEEHCVGCQDFDVWCWRLLCQAWYSNSASPELWLKTSSVACMMSFQSYFSLEQLRENEEEMRQDEDDKPMLRLPGVKLKLNSNFSFKVSRTDHLSNIFSWLVGRRLLRYFPSVGNFYVTVKMTLGRKLHSMTLWSWFR